MEAELRTPNDLLPLGYQIDGLEPNPERFEMINWTSTCKMVENTVMTHYM